MSALKYNVTPVVEGEPQDWPLTPEPLSAEDVAVVIVGRLKSMEAQGYWRDNSGMTVPLTSVQYIIEVAEEVTEEDLELLAKLEEGP